MDNKKLIFSACYNGKIEAIEKAIEAGADINSKNDVGETPLMAYVSGRHDVAVAEFLLKKGADVNAKNIDGWSVLMHAAHWDKRWNPMTELLIKHGADVNHKSEDGWTPLLLACCDKGVDWGPVNMLLESKDIDVNGAGKHFEITPLIMSIKGRYFTIDLVKKLIDHGADVNKPIDITNTKIKPNLPRPLAVNSYKSLKTGNKFQGYTPLMIAVTKGKNKAIKVLCESGADMHVKSANGDSAISLAKGKKTESVLAKYL